MKDTLSQLSNVRTTKAHDPMLFEFSDEDAPGEMHPLDSPAVKERWDQVREWRRQAHIAQRDNRREQALDAAFYDGKQWREEDVKVLEARGQAPLVFNVIKNTVNWVLGTERKSRIDYRVLPRGKEDVNAAKTKEKVIKYTQDVSKAHYHRSRAFSDASRVGIGWLELGVRSDPDEEPLFYRYESWRNMWYDHLGVEADCSDWRFVFREKWCDLDIAQAMFPERAQALKIEAENTNRLYPYLPDDFDLMDPATEGDQELYDAFDTYNRRERVRLIECWYRVPASVKVLKTKGALNGAIYREGDPLHDYMVQYGHASLYDAVKMVVRCMIYSGSTVLQDEESPYRHNRLPFIPIFCYRRDDDNAPYGLIRDLRDPQEDLNKRRSKALFALSANRVIADEGAVADPVEAHKEANRPDGYIEVKTGKRFEINSEKAVAAEHVEMARDDERFIQSISGVTDENLGKKTNAISGKAIEARQLQGLTTSGPVFDNLYFAVQTAGEVQLSLIEQFYTEEKVIRILGDSSKMEFIEINKYDQETGEMADDITATKADFIISQQDFRETLRLAMFESLSELVTNLASTAPNVALALLDLVVDASDLPGKEEMVARIRKITGQKDPSAEMTEEEKLADQQREQAEAEAQAKQQALMDAMAQSELMLKQFQGLNFQMDAVVKKLNAMKSAVEVAGTMAAAPELAIAADGIMEDAQGGEDGSQ